MTNSNSINNDNKQKVTAVAANDFAQESTKQRNLSEVILKESEKHSQDYKSKEAQSIEYKEQADDLMKRHKTLIAIAEYLKKNESAKLADAIKAIAGTNQALADDIATLVPRDATVEEIEKIAEKFEDRAKKLYTKAQELKNEANQSKDLAQKLKEQANYITERDNNFSDLHLQSALSKNEQLRKIYVKLGIYNLENQYKSQIAYAEKIAQEKAQI